MRAHIIENGKVVNTIEVESLDALPGFTLVDAEGGGKIGDDFNGATGEFTTPAPAVDAAALIAQYDAIIQDRIDDAARQYGYGDPNKPELSPILHAVGYADEPAVVEYQAEGRVLRAFRSRTWRKAQLIQDAVLAGERPIPTEAELLAELDEAVPLPTEADVAVELARLSATA